MDRIQQLSNQINERLKDTGTPTIAAAESCSGGGVASAITTWSGSSAYFLGSIVAYVNEAKASLLGVPQQVLDELGAVSPECAKAMAERRAGSLRRRHRGLDHRYRRPDRGHSPQAGRARIYGSSV